jgi:hypothetical protein
MMNRQSILALVLLAPSLAAQTPVLPTPLGPDTDPAVVAEQVRAYVLAHLPAVLFEKNEHWGDQKLVARGIEWKGKGVRPKVQKSYKNDGTWRKIHVTAVDSQRNLVLQIRDVRPAEPGRLTFTMFVADRVEVNFEQQNWHDGLRLYAGSARAKTWVQATLACELTTRLETTKGAFVPDVILRGRVLSAQVQYYDFKVEHVAGVGGDLAKAIGKAALDALHQWRPSIERNLFRKADAAIIKAGDTKEIRLSLAKLVK